MLHRELSALPVHWSIWPPNPDDDDTVPDDPDEDEDDEAPETPTDEPPPIPVQDPPDQDLPPLTVVRAAISPFASPTSPRWVA